MDSKSLSRGDELLDVARKVDGAMKALRKKLVAKGGSVGSVFLRPHGCADDNDPVGKKLARALEAVQDGSCSVLRCLRLKGGKEFQVDIRFQDRKVFLKIYGALSPYYRVSFGKECKLCLVRMVTRGGLGPLKEEMATRFVTGLGEEANFIGAVGESMCGGFDGSVVLMFSRWPIRLCHFKDLRIDFPEGSVLFIPSKEECETCGMRGHRSDVCWKLDFGDRAEEVVAELKERSLKNSPILMPGAKKESAAKKASSADAVGGAQTVGADSDGSKLGERKCFRCGDDRHLIAECPKPDKRRCFRCGGSGHMAARCTGDRVCFRCGSKEHISVACPRPAWCPLCRRRGHTASKCSKGVERARVVFPELSAEAGEDVEGAGEGSTDAVAGLTEAVGKHEEKSAVGENEAVNGKEDPVCEKGDVVGEKKDACDENKDAVDEKRVVGDENKYAVEKRDAVSEKKSITGQESNRSAPKEAATMEGRTAVSGRGEVTREVLRLREGERNLEKMRRRTESRPSTVAAVMNWISPTKSSERNAKPASGVKGGKGPTSHKNQ